MKTAHISQELQRLQRERSVILKSRNMQANRLQAIVAGTLGYHSGLSEKDRAKMFVEATSVIKQVAKGNGDSPMKGIIQATLFGIDKFNDYKSATEKELVRLAKTLPVHEWVECKEQRGFGALFLAIVIGETGDLSNYANPAKVWKRLGCAPWTFGGETLMGATWRSGKQGKLPADQWEAFGYSPRRRSIAYLIGEGIVKQNFVKPDGVEGATDADSVGPVSGKGGGGIIETEGCGAGPYRSRYDTAKTKIQSEHPDYCKLRCHLHGMLLATKLLLKNLWVEWNGHPPIPGKA